MIKILRILIYSTILFFTLGMPSTTDMPLIQDFAKQIGIPPFWNAEEMENYRWNNYLRKYGKPPKHWPISPADY